MKTVVITGSARGLGLEMAKQFKKNNINIIISDLSEEKLLKAEMELNNINSSSIVKHCVCDVTKSQDIQNLIDYTLKEFKKIDIWINNAGINQPDKPIWELTEEEIDLIINVDLKGTIIASKLVIEEMSKQKDGAIYNIEGYGSNDAMMLGLSIYGTSKRAITYFTQALAKESEEKNTGIIIGRLSPGIMITDFITNSLGDKGKIELPEKTKKVYNILGDYPDIVAKFLVEKVLNNTKNNAHIEWLTTKKAAWRFMTSGFNKRDFFKKSKGENK
jgi:short-subunit dehydrogenase